MPILHILSGPGAGRAFEFSQPAILIGRDTACDFALTSRTVSRQHARIRRGDGDWLLEDLRSVNGTVLNGHRIGEPVRLADNDRIRIHDIVMAFHLQRPQIYDEEVAAPYQFPDSDVIEADGSGDRAGHYDSWLPRGRTVSAGSSDSSTSSLSPSSLSPGALAGGGAAGELESGTVVTKLDSRVFAPDRLDVNADVKLRALLEIARSLGSSLECDIVLGRILDSLFRVFPQAHRGYVLLADDPAGPIRTGAARHRGNPGDTISPIDSTLARRVMADGVAFCSGERADEEADEVMIFDDSRSVMCAPLVSPNHAALGVVQIESVEPNHRFRHQDLDVLASVAFLAGQAVENSRLHRMQLDLESRRRQMDLAANVQQRFLPQEPPKLAGYDFCHHYRAADFVAGDYFDYIELPDGRLAFAQGDVCGKGMAAALLMAHLCSDVRSSLLATSQPAAAMGRLNKHLARTLPPGSFVTLVLGVIDPRDHSLTLVNAAHMPPLRRSAAGEVGQLGAEEARLPLGADSDTEYVECVVELAPGDMIVCYTDGVSDAQNRAGQFYGADTIERLVKAGAENASSLLRCIIDDVSKFVAEQPQTDDVCLICWRRV